MQLKEELTLIQRGTRSITEYLHAVKALADEIAIIVHQISDDDLTLYVLNGLGPDFWEITTPIGARESSMAFEELHDLLVGHDAYLRHLEVATQQLVLGDLGPSQSQKLAHEMRFSLALINSSPTPSTTDVG